ncbi:hypothetical protein G6F57_019608 [Rhizopus arrhizus]|nr:hypothetical protein G6F57_019608 [Rhizopus arrhizus]
MPVSVRCTSPVLGSIIVMVLPVALATINDFSSGVRSGKRGSGTDPSARHFRHSRLSKAQQWGVWRQTYTPVATPQQPPPENPLKTPKSHFAPTGCALASTQAPEAISRSRSAAARDADEGPRSASSTPPCGPMTKVPMPVCP